MTPADADHRHPRTRRLRALPALPALAVCASLAGAAVPTAWAQTTPGLTAAPQMADVYDAVFDARFDQVPALLERTCPPAPREACVLMEVVSLWWQIQLDPDNTTRDARFQARVDAAIAATEAWTDREPDRAEAWFYRGGAYGARVQWRVLRGQRLAAARDGNRAKEALERAIALDPAMDDAYFGIGLYRYYADAAPAAARLLRWLFALPGGDRERGLAEMRRARDHGRLLRDEGDYQLHLLYLWYEDEPERARTLLEGLRARHPRNPHFLQAIAEVEDLYLHDASASLLSYRTLLAAAQGKRVAEPVLAETIARLGIARQLDQLFETDEAVEQLQAVIDANPTAPAGAGVRARARLREARARLDVPAYRLSLEGWRALERGDLPQASQAILQSLALAPDDALTQYRHGRLLLAQHREEEALVVFAEIHTRHDTTPATIYTLACMDAARVHERAGSVAIALDLYRSATTVSGGDRRMKALARQHVARLETRVR